ncbi:MAG: hypothetical protein HZB19_17885 [Chloroflexi bacterium]|nr:hypothetical protein [Chloroflexota bacterium]
MTEKSLAEKMKLKSGMNAAVVNAPSGCPDQLTAPRDADISTRFEFGPFDWLQVFVKSKAELDSLAPLLVKALKPVSLLWLTFPKGTSKIQTDLTRDKGWDSLQALDLKWINQVSVNETWSAFALRPYKEGEARRSFR